MGLFSSDTKKRGNAVLDRLSEEVEKLSFTVAELRGAETALGKTAGLQRKIEQLKEDVADLTRQKKEQEREIEHKLGLHRDQVEHEREQLKETHALDVERAKLEMEKDNLSTERGAFEKEMKFRTERFEAEIGYVKDILGQILERLPDVNVALKLGGEGATAKSTEEEKAK